MDEVAQPVVPRVTALVVSYNQVDALRACLTALEASHGRESLEILVVDNGSSDGSSTLDTEFPNTTFMRIPRNFGRTKALNVGTRTAAGDYLFLLAPEVQVAPGTVNQLAGYLDENAEAAAVCPLLAGMAQFFRLPTPSSGPDRTWVPPPTDPAPVPVEAAALDALMVRKYFVRGLNYFDDRYGNSWIDAELAFQIRRAQKKIVLLPEAACSVSETAAAPSRKSQALQDADWLLGAASFFGKHYGAMPSLGLRARSTLSGFLGLLAVSDFPYRWTRFISLLTGQKVDGSQSVQL